MNQYSNHNQFRIISNQWDNLVYINKVLDFNNHLFHKVLEFSNN